MNRSDLLRAVANDTKLPMAQVEVVVDSFLRMIELSLAAGEDVGIRRFGKFERRVRRPVVRRNPRTGEEISVPERHSVAFIPSDSVRDRLNA
jgi:nucleoid DNA-binding protein